MNSQLRQKAIDLRTKEELSYSQIWQKLGVPKSTLSYWLKEFPLSEEKILMLRRQGWQRGETSREIFRMTMRRKRETRLHEEYMQQRKKFLGITDISFFVAGLILYLAEGGKTDYSRIILSNTDPRIIKFFVRWLNEFLQIPKDKMRAWLHLYENMDLQKEKEFWKNELGFKNGQFYKPYVSKLKPASFSYKESYRHGTCSIYFGSVEKKQELTMAIQAFLDIYEERTKGM